MKKRFILLFIFMLSAACFPGVNESGNLFDMPLSPVRAARAEEIMKVNSINLDNSDSIIFLGTSSSSELSEVKISKKTLTEPDRVFIDIENAVTTFPAQTYELKNSKLTKLKITQNSLSPDVVRLVLYNSPGYNTQNIKVLNVKNNIIIKLDNDVPSQKYLTRVYSETKDSSFDYYDKTVISKEQPAQTVPKTETEEIFNKVQQAFKDNSQELVRPNIEQKQARLKSRYFLDKVGVQNGNLVISGIGVINVSKPFALQEPSRIVFDLPNTIVNQELRDKEFLISESVTAKIGQFDASTARIVVKAPDVSAFSHVYSKNLNTLLIGSNLQSYVTSTKTKLAYFKESSVNASTDVLNITFSEPVIYSIKRDIEKINFIIYNLADFDINSFNNVAASNKTGYSAKHINNGVYVLSFPIKNNVSVDCYETLDAKQLRFVFTKTVTQQPVQSTPSKPFTPPVTVPSNGSPRHVPGYSQTGRENQPKEKVPKEKVKPGISVEHLLEKQKEKEKRSGKNKKNEDANAIKLKNKIIILDPGHGGNDTGAFRKNVLEKDLTLDIALQVRDILVSRGFRNVIMTRSTDKTLTLQERTDIANNYRANIYVSIHINASVKPEINGVETHYYTEKGYDVAQMIHKELKRKVCANDRGLFKSRFYVINHTEAPAVLLELGFISNDRERAELTSKERQAASAEAIAEGIINYLMEHLDE